MNPIAERKFLEQWNEFYAKQMDWLRSQGLTPEQIKKAMEPAEGFVQSCVECCSRCPIKQDKDAYKAPKESPS